MMIEPASNDADDSQDGTTPSVDGGSRSIEAILERSRARRQRRSHTRAPGFVHGNTRLDTLYETFGPRWVERTAFVEYLPADRSNAAGWTVARFDEGFLTIDHGLDAELDDLDAWLDAALEEVDRVVVLEVDADAPAQLDDRQVDVLSVQSSRPRIQELEHHYLGMARDRDFGGAAPFSPSPCERLLESRLDVMTLVCLCEKLI